MKKVLLKFISLKFFVFCGKKDRAAFLLPRQKLPTAVFSIFSF